MKLTLLSLLLIISPDFAYAYLDPISISYGLTIIIGLITFIFHYITNFLSNFTFLKKTHLVNLLLINTPLVQFLSLNINKAEYINYYYLILINSIFIFFYFIFFLILRRFFLKSYKDILFITSVLFLFQFQFFDIYKLSQIINIRIILIAITIILIFFSLLFYKKTMIQNFLSRFILIFNMFFLGMILYDYTSIYFEIKSIKDLIKEDKKVEIKNIEKTGRNIYFIISDGKIDLNLFQNKMLKSSKNKKLIINYKTLFENKDFTIINDSINNNKTLSTASSLGGLFNLKDNFEINNAKYSSSYPTLMRFFENTPLAKELEKNNYNFYWSGNIWHDCNIYNKNLCLVNNKKYNKLVYSSRTIWNYLSSSYLGKIFKDYWIQ